MQVFAFLIWVLLTIITPLAEGLLQVNPIIEDLGYTQIKLKEIEIVNETSTILHIINPLELNEILAQIEMNVANLNTSNKILLDSEITNIKAKIKSIIPSSIHRKRRGLINAVGTVNKWLFGTMDSDDREEILNHLNIIEENTHNSITTINSQISINTHFNKSLITLKNTIEQDRLKILQAYNEIKETNKQSLTHSLFLDQIIKLRYLEDKINQIQDNIASAKHNIVHPSILTAEEISLFNIDFFKLKLIKMGIMAYKNDSLVFALKIPQNYILTNLILITPLPNIDNYEIDETNEYIVKIENKTYLYEEDVLQKDLKVSKNCIFHNNCKLRFNNKTSMEILDDETILIKNAKNENLIHNCDNRDIILNKNYLINFYNCQIDIFKQRLSNQIKTIQAKYYLPNKDSNITFEKNLSFENIAIKHIENIKEINELKYHKIVSYSFISIIIFVILIISIVFVILWLKYKKQNNVLISQKIEKNFTFKPKTTESNIFELAKNPKIDVLKSSITSDSSKSIKSLIF